jgi:hypothetical protein
MRKGLKITAFTAILLILTTGFFSCEKEKGGPIEGKWEVVNPTLRYWWRNCTFEFTKNKIILLDTIEDEIFTMSYKWISKNTIKIEFYNFPIGGAEDYFFTRNDVIFHTTDSVTITNWVTGIDILPDAAVDLTIIRIAK